MVLKALVRVGVGAACIILTACSTFQPEKQTIKISCNVQNVILRVDGDKHPCPSEVAVRRDKKVLVEAYKEGHDKYSKLIDYHLSSSAKWDAVGTVVWFFPVFGFLSPGAWDLDETEINVVLTDLRSPLEPLQASTQ